MSPSTLLVTVLVLEASTVPLALASVILAPIADKAPLRASVRGLAELLEPPTWTPVSSMVAGWPCTLTPERVMCSSWLAIDCPSVREVDVETSEPTWTVPPAREMPFSVEVAVTTNAPWLS